MAGKSIAVQLKISIQFTLKSVNVFLTILFTLNQRRTSTRSIFKLNLRISMKRFWKQENEILETNYFAVKA